jgi:hypothetical protein
LSSLVIEWMCMDQRSHDKMILYEGLTRSERSPQGAIYRTTIRLRTISRRQTAIIFGC